MKQQRTRVSSYALITSEQGILLCRISDELPRWTGQWTLPGGGIHFGEDPELAMVREVEEETGLHVKPVSVLNIDSLYEDIDGDEFHGIRIIYEVTVIGGELRNECGGSTDLCSWHKLETLDDIQLVGLVKIGLSCLSKSQK